MTQSDPKQWFTTIRYRGNLGEPGLRPSVFEAKGMESTRFVNTQFLILGESACANPSYSVADPYPICKRGECSIDA